MLGFASFIIKVFNDNGCVLKIKCVNLRSIIRNDYKDINNI